MPALEISRSEIELESQFEPRLWSLIHDTPTLYEALLRNLAPVGVSAADLRPDAGDGSVGGGGLVLWLFGFQANARLRLESLFLKCTDLSRTSRAGAMAALAGLMTTVEQVSRAPFKFKGHTLTYACHGRIEGIKTAEFIRQFVSAAPSISNGGAHVASGTAFYFGQSDPVLSSIVTLDPSRLIEGGLFLRVAIVTDGTPKSAEELSKLTEEKVYAVFAALDLQVPQVWS